MQTNQPMNGFQKLVIDHETSSVPVGESVSGFRVALIVLGIAISLPSFLTGAQIGQAIGLINSVAAFVIGGMILTVGGSITATVASRARLTTYMMVLQSFGSQGGKFVNAFLALTMLGWFGVNAALFGSAVYSAIEVLGWTTNSISTYIILGGILMIATTVFGFKALDKLSLLAVPVLVVMLVSILFSSLDGVSISQLAKMGGREMSLGHAISAVVGAEMVMVATMPDVARFLPGRNQAILAMVLAFLIGGTIVLLSAAIPSLVTGQLDLMKIIAGLEMGLWALIVMVFATWTSNAANLYGSGLSLASVFQSIDRWKLTVAAGGIGTAIALVGMSDVFIPFLLFLSAFIPPIASIYVIDFWGERSEEPLDGVPDYAPAFRLDAFAAWIGGTLVALATLADAFFITTIPACDAMLISGIIYSVLRFRRNRSNDPKIQHMR